MTDHPVINELKHRIGGSMADEVDLDNLVDEMLLLSPATRADILIKTGPAADGEIPATKDYAGRSQVTDLRQVAQRDLFHRKLLQLDREMRKAGR